MLEEGYVMNDKECKKTLNQEVHITSIVVKRVGAPYRRARIPRSSDLCVCVCVVSE